MIDVENGTFSPKMRAALETALRTSLRPILEWVWFVDGHYASREEAQLAQKVKASRDEALDKILSAVLRMKDNDEDELTEEEIEAAADQINRDIASWDKVDGGPISTRQTDRDPVLVELTGAASALVEAQLAAWPGLEHQPVVQRVIRAIAATKREAPGPVNCSNALRRNGKSYPRTCERCGMGPCPFYNNDGSAK